MISDLLQAFTNTIYDIIPIGLLIGLFQIYVVKKPIPNLKKIILGIIMVILGLSLFIVGLDLALFPLGKIMATQLSSAEFTGITPQSGSGWYDYFWIYLFAVAIGFSSTIAEPALIAVSLKAKEVSGGTINETLLRIIVAIGVSVSLIISINRIINNIPLYTLIIVGYLIVIIQTIFTPKNMIGIAYDSGGVTTSTVTVPILAAIGLGLSSNIPGRNPAVDGFGLIALACLFPIITVMGYIQIMDLIVKFSKKRKK